MGTNDFGGLLEPHPAINKLSDPARRTRDNAGAFALTGFVGKSDDADRVRLHRSLEHLTHWIEVNRADILHVAVADKDLQRVTLWLQNDAPIARSTLSLRDATREASADTDLIAVNRGRLRMMVRPGISANLSGVGGPTGSCGCSSKCSSCWPCFFT